MSWSNYDDVLEQLRGYGLEVDHLVVDDRLHRVRTTEDKSGQGSGWYVLHEMRVDDGEVLIVGAFGDYRQGDNGHGNHQKIALKKRQLTDEQRAAMKARLKEDRKRAEAQRRKRAEKAALRAQKAWSKMLTSGESDYLRRKGVQAHGLRFSPQGNLVIPVLDGAGMLHGLQVIYADPQSRPGDKKGIDKDFWPAGLAKRGHFHLIGAPTWIVLVAEGYATAASLHEATGLPVAVAFDAGNLQPVAEALRKRYRTAKILICADDDFATPGNPGITYADNAALAVSGAWVAPRFDADPFRTDLAAAPIDLDPATKGDERKALKQEIERIRAGRPRLTDFNDLHQLEGVHAVRVQIEEKIAALGWKPGEGSGADNTTQGGGENALRPITSPLELLERYTLIYGGGGAVFDAWEHDVIPLSDMRDACASREIHRIWMEHPERKLCRKLEVGFDPAGLAPEIKCNLWGGWPTTPKKGRCEALLDLLEYLCSAEDNPHEIFKWALKWLAYPIQHPGAKMKTSLVFHGPQGAGKNMFFEAYAAIYGKYARVIDQAAVEDNHNDWASAKLFMIADEVVARQELYHTKGKLKALITGDQIRINPKHVAAREERNHMNLVFLSNEVQPLVLEEGDRRYTIIWTPPDLPLNFYQDVGDEIKEGGIEALHDYLLNLDLGDFSPHTKPPMTKSKADLIDLGLDSTDRFMRAWLSEEIDGIPVVPCLSSELFKLYQIWCRRVGIHKAAPQHILLARLGKRRDVKKAKARYGFEGNVKMAAFVFPEGQFDPPDGSTQAPWLKKCSEEFNTALEDFKRGSDDF